MSPPILRPFAPGDEAGILALYREVFALHLTLDEWRWYFAGREPAVIALAEVDGQIIGHYAVQPRPFSVGPAGLVVGSMVAPAFRNLATFVGLARAAYAMCRERGIRFVYAFPNDNVWLVRQRMLDWVALPQIHALAAAVADFRPTGPAGGARLHPGQGFPSWAVGSPAVSATLPSDWLAWRLHEKPGAPYPVYAHSDGYIALKTYRPSEGPATGHLIDWRVRPGAEASVGSLLLAQAKAHFAQDGVERVSTWLLPASPLYPVARQAGLVEESAGKNFGYLALDPALSASGGLAGAWDIRMADSDVY